MTELESFFKKIEQDYKILDKNFMDLINDNFSNKISHELSSIFESHKMTINLLNKQRNDLIREMFKLLSC